MSQVIVFDNDIQDARLIRTVAAARGHDVKVYADAPKWGEELLKDSDCKVVLALKLQHSDAFDAMSRLAAQSFRGEIILTARENAEYLNIATAYGRNNGLNIRAMLAKPLNGETLGELLN